MFQDYCEDAEVENGLGADHANADLIVVVEDDVLQLEGIVDDGAGDVEPRAHVHVSHEAPQQGRVGF